MSRLNVRLPGIFTATGALMVLMLALGLATPGSTVGQPASDTVVFDAPHAHGELGQDVVFETEFRTSVPPRRVELVLGGPDATSTSVSLAAFEPTGPDRWRARVVQTGHVPPNTPYRFTFRAVTADGERFSSPEGRHRVTDPRFPWRSLQGDGVTVWWYEGGEGFAQRALDVAEAAMAAASDLFGVARVDPVDFFIYADDQAFREALGPATRENVGGEAHPAIDTLFGLILPSQVSSDWVDELVSHELAHLVFDEATANPYGYPPRWFNEGLAVYLSRGLTDGDRTQVAAAARAGTIMPLEGLAAQFPTRPGRFGLAYAESTSAVDRLIERHGDEAVLRLVRALRAGDSFEEAFETATGERFEAFEDDWLASLGAQRPAPLGPVAAPPGPSVAAPSSPAAAAGDMGLPSAALLP
jgi:hypothetical protein